MDSSTPSLEHAKDHIFERVSVALDHMLLTEALRHGRGRIRLSHLKGELGVQESASRVLRSGREVATETSLERERSMIAAINRGVGSIRATRCWRFVCRFGQFAPRAKERCGVCAPIAGSGREHQRRGGNRQDGNIAGAAARVEGGWSYRVRRRSHDECRGGAAESWLCRCHHDRAVCYRTSVSAKISEARCSSSTRLAWFRRAR